MTKKNDCEIANLKDFVSEHLSDIEESTGRPDGVEYVLSSNKDKVTTRGVRQIRETHMSDVSGGEYSSPPEYIDIKKDLYYALDGKGNVGIYTWRRLKKAYSPRQARRALKRARRVVRGLESNPKQNEVREVIDGIVG